ncbi:CvpA family protein [bacterium]|nr:CvpA family protein [bacterium]MBU1754454.1 CvpA family protein [bacterium]
MNILDILFLAVIGISIILSTMKGLTREIFSLVGIIAGIVVAGRTFGNGAILLQQWMPHQIAKPVAFAIIAILVNILVNFGGIILQRIMKIVMLGWVDSLGGIIFGIIRGMLLVGVAIIVLLKFPVGASKELIGSSNIIPVFKAFLQAICLLLPPEFAAAVKAATILKGS